jgi:hypothetical protein
MRKEDFFARTMHTPDDPARAALRAALRETSKALLPLHRALIDAAKEDYLFAGGTVSAPTHMLQLLQDDPFFLWLKPLTSLIVDIDELARVDFEPGDVEAIAKRVDHFFGGSADPSFSERYVPILQRSVDVAIGHAGVRQAAAKLTA